MPSVLVTGAGGFIGRRVVSAASHAGYRVSGIVRQATSLAGAGTVIQHDLRNPLNGPPSADWVFHLAGGYAGAGKKELDRVDAQTADNVIDWGFAAGIKNWIFASAAEVYGDVCGVANEEAPQRPVIPYGRLKLTVERLFAERLKTLSNHRIVILRIGEVYGRDGRLIRELTARMKRGFCPWPGSGHVLLSFVHVDDVAQAFLCAARTAPMGISVYNVADDMPVTWQGFLLRVAQLLGTKPPAFLPVSLVQAYALCSALAHRATRTEPILTMHALRLLLTPKALSNARLKSALGFKPQYPTISEGLEEAFRGLSHDS
jgi:nucleoside-diphosphate-sugar epimerase